MPVKYDKGEGQFPLNKTHLSYLVKALGSNSDTWAGATYEASIIPQNNPQTSKQVLSWTIITETITKGKK